VVGVDDFFVLCCFSVTSRSGLLSVVRTSYFHYYVMPETILLFNYIIIYIKSSFPCFISVCGYNSVVSLFTIYVYLYPSVYVCRVLTLTNIVFVAFLFFILFYFFVISLFYS
jgi:hypothetical protein